MKKLGTSLLATMGMAWAMGLGLGLGGDVGYSMSSYSVDTFETSSSGLLYGGGAKIDLWITDAMGLDLGGRYDMYNYSHTENDITTTAKYSVLAIPIFLKYGLPMAGMKPYFGFGFSVLKQMSGTVQVDTFPSADVADSLLEMDYAVLAGAGLNFPMGPLMLNPDLRFLYNLTPKGKNDTLSNSSASQMDFTLGINFLYSMPLGGE